MEAVEEIDGFPEEFTNHEASSTQDCLQSTRKRKLQMIVRERNEFKRRCMALEKELRLSSLKLKQDSVARCPVQLASQKVILMCILLII